MTKRGERMMEIATLLSERISYMHSGSLLIAENEKNLKDLEIALTPYPDGWPGSNEEKRKIAKLLALQEVPEYQSLVDELEKARVNMSRLNSEVSVLETERRSLEWCIRDEMLAVHFEDEVPDNPGTDPAGF